MQFIKKLIPTSILKFIRPYYHGAVAVLASWYFGNPSSKMIVVGVTGTAGKSTTVQMLARILNHGYTDGTDDTDKHPHPDPLPEGEGEKQRCGFITTISFFDGKQEYVNKHGLSMPGGWMLQKQLKQMLVNGCNYAIVECTSEGLAQNRHLGITFDVAVLTNLSHAHIEAHGSFENYRSAKGKLFKALSVKGLGVNVVNGDDESAEWFLKLARGKKVVAGFGVAQGRALQQKQVEGLHYIGAMLNDNGFTISNVKFEVRLPGKFNNYNALMAAVAANQLGVSFETCANAIATFTKIRGRMEAVENNRGINIFVDYGCEPASFRAALVAAKNIPHNRLIHVFGSTGGHRDKSKQFEFGKISAEFSDYIIITNDDVYDSDPQEIGRNIEAGIKKYELRSPKYEILLDRRQAVAKALSSAQKNDTVLITGKGSEQFLVLPGNKRIEWDEVGVVKQELNKISNI